MKRTTKTSTKEALDTIERNNTLCGITNALLSKAQEKGQDAECNCEEESPIGEAPGEKFELISCEGAIREEMDGHGHFYNGRFTGGGPFSVMVTNALHDHLKESPRVFDGCRFLDRGTGWELKEFDAQKMYQAAVHMRHFLEDDTVWAEVGVFDEDGEQVYHSSNFSLVNVDLYIEHLGGNFPLGDGCSATILGPEFFHDGHDEDECYD